MAELLEHHARIIEILSYEYGTPPQVVDYYISQCRPYVVSLRLALIDLLTRAKSGEKIVGIPESTIAGDEMCAVCSKYGADCPNGHRLIE
jgi:hypothetical protein